MPSLPHHCAGLPDAYGRGRIIGDYRRVALYSVDALIADKTNQKMAPAPSWTRRYSSSRGALEQIRALKEPKQLGEIYGFDLSRPTNFKRGGSVASIWAT